MEKAATAVGGFSIWYRTMGRESDRKEQESAYAKSAGHVGEDERGHRIWQDTIEYVKLSLMKTGIFDVSESRERRLKRHESKTATDGNDIDEDSEITDEPMGFDPYDSANQ